MKQKLKLAYKNMWPDHDPERQQPRDFFRLCLEQHYNVIIDNHAPDMVIYSLGGAPIPGEYYSDPILVGYSGEVQDAPNTCDLLLGFHYHVDALYKRLPLWVLYIDWDDKNPTGHPLHINSLLSRHELDFVPRTKFCNFTYRNPVKSRIEFFLALNQKLRVDSTGSLFNNTGKLLGDKTIELKDYQFTIAWESSNMQGYVTEKLLEPLAAGSIPIYSGGSASVDDFNPRGFIRVEDFPNIHHAIDYVMHVQHDVQLQKQYWQQPVWQQAPDWPNRVFGWFYSLIADKKPHLRL